MLSSTPAQRACQTLPGFPFCTQPGNSAGRMLEPPRGLSPTDQGSLLLSAQCKVSQRVLFHLLCLVFWLGQGESQSASTFFHLGRTLYIEALPEGTLLICFPLSTQTTLHTEPQGLLSCCLPARLHQTSSSGSSHLHLGECP